MARGRPPILDHKRGIHGQAPKRGESKPEEQRCRAVKPKRFALKENQELSAIWDEHITPCYWLLRGDSAKSAMFCYAWREYWKAPEKFGSQRLNSLRGLASELGMDPISRARMSRQYMPVRDFRAYRKQRKEREAAAAQGGAAQEAGQVDEINPAGFDAYQ